MPHEPDDAAVLNAIDVLYAEPPELFTNTRGRLSAQARADGNPAAAKQIAALRKPTVAAYLVNKLARENPDAVDELTELAAELREAQEAFDADAMRKLSSRRRTVVQDLTRAALRHSGKGKTSPVVDEVRATFEAALADAGVAERLGRLERAEQWSGFGFDGGFGSAAAPALRLVQGGKGAPSEAEPNEDAATPAKAAKGAAKEAAEEAAKKSPPKPTAAERRRLEKAQREFDEADAEMRELETAEDAASDRLRAGFDLLAQATKQMEDAKRELAHYRDKIKRQRKLRREARSALDRIARQFPPE